jgi:DNA-binding transcriptional regulator YiaG
MKQLREQRRAVGLSQQRLATAARIPRWKIAWAETGRFKLSEREAELLRGIIAKRAARTAARLAA